MLLFLPVAAAADEASAREPAANIQGTKGHKTEPKAEDEGTDPAPDAVKTAAGESKAQAQSDSKKQAPDQKVAKPPYLRPEHAVAVNAKTVGEGTLVLAQLDPKERAQLLGNGLVLASNQEGDEELAGYIRAWVIAEQPRDKVFELLIQPSAQSTFLPRLVSSTTVERKATSELTRFHVRVGLINVHTQVLHQWWPEISRLAWALDPNFDNGVRHQEGYWNVYALDDKTSLLEYGTILKTSALVPKFVQDRLTRSDLPGAMEAMKKYLDSGGTWRR